MNNYWKEGGLALILVVSTMLILTVLYAEPSSGLSNRGEGTEEFMPSPSENVENLHSTPEMVGVLNDGQPVQMELEEYVLGVVLGELPISFHEESIKALAVCARTFALKRNESGDKHAGGLVCTDSSCCQAYLAPDDYLAAGGSEDGLRRMRRCVEATKGQVLVYEGELIEAAYFACSGGYTEDAVAVWGTDVPYLIAQESTGEEDAECFMDVKSCEIQTFLEYLGLPPGEFVISDIHYTPGYGVASMNICGKKFTGQELRSILGLRSTIFRFTTDKSRVLITTKGFGHRVGLSQYGADAMACNGMNYREILSFYYPGTGLMNEGFH